MIINKIKLENIRSYVNEEINFTSGSTLLSGNIGSGKSSTLLAIDFALFGFTRGELSGDALLRNGEKKGSVELHFNIDGKDVVIKRGLKKSGDSVSQDYGYIYSGGVKKEGTANELKLAILDLLKYPKEMLTKKSLIYRYTVYTPQEEMKQILIGNKELRLDVLRKIFNIDKYKRIKENSKILLSKLKDKRKEFEIVGSDLEIKEKEELENKTKIRNFEEFLNKINIDIELNSNLILNKKKDVQEEEIKIEDLRELKKQLDISKVNFGNKESNLENNKRRIEELESSVKILEESVKKEFSAENVLSKIEEKNKEIFSKDENVKEINNKIQEIKVKTNHANEIIQSIKDLKQCPTCKQDVKDEYKNEIIKNESERIKDFEDFLEKYSQNYKDINKDLIFLKEELESLRKIEKDIELNKLKLESLNEKKEFKIKIEEENLILKKEIEELRVKELNLISKLKDFSEDNYKRLKEKLESLVRKEKELEIKRAELNSEVRNVKINLEKLETEIKIKKDAKERLSKIKELQYFLEDKFGVLMDSLERKIMLRVHYDFNDLFKKWFDILVDNELIKIDLDEEFSPKIEQNGYDIDYNYLSGGEKTAAALAYRLALNQVINNLMSEIKTRDLLILDEPTDGFSDEQLERMRMVLEELNIKQIIIVSHEDKIESFVENVIKIEKKEHVSRVV